MNRFMKLWLLWLGVAAGGVTLAGVLLTQLPWRFMVNTTASEPYGLYLVHAVSGRHYQVGDLVAFHYSAPKWAEHRYYPNGAVFFKRVGAVYPQHVAMVFVGYRQGYPVYQDDRCAVRPPRAMAGALVLGAQGVRYAGGVPGLASQAPEVAPTCHDLGVTLAVDSHGRRVYPWVYTGAALAPNTYYMQSTDVPNSYDSRYYGPVPEKAVIGPARPIFTW